MSNKTMNANDVSVFDTTTVNANSKGFKGVVFDGRYVYFIPDSTAFNAPSGQITRYDTTGSFTATSSYSVFDTATVNANSTGFNGAVFDGRYIYLVPYYGPGFVGKSGQITRYDTTGSFTAASSYSVYDTTAVNANSKGFIGAVFDGRYIYFVPNNNGAYFGQVTRYDTTGSFTSVGSYSVFDITTVNANAKGFYNAVFDGRYVYFVPYYNGTVVDGLVARYDTTTSFTSAASYTVFDMSTVNANSVGFNGAIFDGRYVYYIPYYGPGFADNGQVTRYDTTGSFTSTSSYSVFDTSTVDPNSKRKSGAVFDGRYIYFAPFFFDGLNMSGLVTRYDTAGSFTAASSYSVFDTATVNANSVGFTGAIFDGHYVYFSPEILPDGASRNGQVTRLAGWTGGIDATPGLAKIARGSDFYMDSAGNIGIGTTSPLALLDVRGAATISGNLTLAGNILPAIDNTYSLGSSPSSRWKSLFLGPGSLHIQSLSTDTGYPALGLDYALGINTAGTLVTSLNGTTNPLMAIKANGFVGIGTSNPTVALDVVGAMKTDTSLKISGGPLIDSFGSDLRVNGQAAFAGAIYPTVTGSYDLGSSVYRWGSAYMSQFGSIDFGGLISLAYSSGQLAVQGGGITFNVGASPITFSAAGNHDITATAGTLRIGAFTALGDIVPSTDNTYSLGSSPSGRWKKCFLLVRDLFIFNQCLLILAIRHWGWIMR